MDERTERALGIVVTHLNASNSGITAGILRNTDPFADEETYALAFVDEYGHVKRATGFRNLDELLPFIVNYIRKFYPVSCSHILASIRLDLAAMGIRLEELTMAKRYVVDEIASDISFFPQSWTVEHNHRQRFLEE